MDIHRLLVRRLERHLQSMTDEVTPLTLSLLLRWGRPTRKWNDPCGLNNGLEKLGINLAAQNMSTDLDLSPSNTADTVYRYLTLPPVSPSVHRSVYASLPDSASLPACVLAFFLPLCLTLPLCLHACLPGISLSTSLPHSACLPPSLSPSVIRLRFRIKTTHLVALLH